MKGLDLTKPIDPTHLEKETLRIYDVCDGCRRCFNLCPSFNTLLDRIDAYESDVGKLTPADHRQVVDECYYCKLCYNHCPYTPPHHYEIDFPHLMIAWKKHLAAERGVSWRDRLLVKTDFLGRMNSLVAPLVNRVLHMNWARRLLELVMGIHRDRHVLPFQRETFSTWWDRRGQKAPGPGSR